MTAPGLVGHINAHQESHQALHLARAVPTLAMPQLQTIPETITSLLTVKTASQHIPGMCPCT